MTTSPAQPDSMSDIDRKLFDSGVEAGKAIRRVEILTFLEQAYLHPATYRDTPDGKAILKIAADLNKQMNKMDKQ